MRAYITFKHVIVEQDNECCQKISDSIIKNGLYKQQMADVLGSKKMGGNDRGLPGVPPIVGVLGTS